MTAQPQILVVGNDPTLAEELEAVVAAMRNYRPVLRYVSDFRQAVEATRSWRPQLALVETTDDFGTLRRLAMEIHAVAPETAVAGVYRPEIFSHDAQESMLLIEAYRAGVQDFIRRPVSSADLAALLDRLLATARREPVRMGKIVCFMSNKGGVGKSTLAVNTACGLAQRHPGEVLLIDASLQIGTCASLLEMRPATTLIDVARQRNRLDETLIQQLAVPHRCGLQLLAAPSNAVEGTEVNDELLSRLISLARRSYRYVVIDTFPIIDSVAMAVLDHSDLVYIVVENVVPTLLAVAKVMELLNSLGIPGDRQRLVLNRYQKVLGNPRREEVAQRLGRPVQHVVPYDRRVITAANLGEPFVLSSGWFNSARRAVQRIVDEIERHVIASESSTAVPIAGAPASADGSKTKK